eukprot:2903721-Pleurochrysis_carterae.AAC.6
MRRCCAVFNACATGSHEGGVLGYRRLTVPHQHTARTANALLTSYSAEKHVAAKRSKVQRAGLGVRDDRMTAISSTRRPNTHVHAPYSTNLAATSKEYENIKLESG